jgi:hypothetical protein
MLKFEEYERAREHNARIIQKCLTNRTTDFSQIKFWEGLTGQQLSMDQLCSKWTDILACAAIGAVPSMKPRGADGYLYYQNRQRATAIEAKLCSIQQYDLALGIRGGLYYSTNLDNYNSKCSMTSHFSGQFDAAMTEETMYSKHRDTFLVPFDRTTNSVIDIYRLDADTTLDLLETRRNKGNTSITLKLSAFQQDGGVFDCEWPVEGFDNWVERMKKQVTRRLIPDVYI